MFPRALEDGHTGPGYLSRDASLCALFFQTHLVGACGVSKIFLSSDGGVRLLGSVWILPLEPDFQVLRASSPCVGAPRRFRLS